MLNLPQPRRPTPTVFDGTTPTFPDWARELRAYLNVSQFEHIDLLDFAYDAEDPLITDIMVQQTPAGYRQHTEILRLSQARQDLRDERTTLQGDPARRDNAVIDQDLQQAQRDLDAQQVLQDATTGVRRAGELPGYYLIIHSTNLTANQTTYFVDFRGQKSVGKCIDQLRHQYSAAARAQPFALLQSIVHPQPRWTEISQQQQFQKWIQDVSAYEMIHPVIDDTLQVSTAIYNLLGPLRQHPLLQVFTTSCLARSTTGDRQLLRQQLHAPLWSGHRQHRPGRQPYQEQEGPRQERKRKRKEG